MQLFTLLSVYTTGFLVSRLSVKYGLIESLLRRALNRRQHSMSRLVLWLIVLSAAISMFIPNFITALAMLPVLQSLIAQLAKKLNTRLARRAGTALGLAVIYGCNIGGMGSLVGSPANGLMLGAMGQLNVAGHDRINFLSWFGWSLPLVAILIAIAWLVLMQLVLRGTDLDHHNDLIVGASNEPPEPVKLIWLLCICWFAFWAVHSALQLTQVGPTSILLLFGLRLRWDSWEALAIAFGLVYLVLLFVPIWKQNGLNRRPILNASDCFTRLPWPALLFVAGALTLSGILIALGLHQRLAALALMILPRELPQIILFFLMLFITTMLTEFFNNTTIAVLLFPLYYALALELHLHPVLALMAVGLASTNAFMTPIATPVNALVYGGVQNFSLSRMLATGFLLNVISAICMAAFLTYYVAWFYQLG